MTVQTARMGSRTGRRYLLCTLLAAGALLLLYHNQSPCGMTDRKGVMITPEKYIVAPDSKRYPYGQNMPLIFIGGMPRSGTTLLRVLLDAHPAIRCGEETRVIPRILGIRQQWLKSPIESKRLQEAGVGKEVLDSAMAAFILEIIARHGEPSERLCNKDPFTLRSAVYLNKLFPNAKYIFMIRDGRAVVHSIITRKVTISGFDLSDVRQCLKKWNSAMEAMNTQCQKLGPQICLPVHYEQLVLHPRVGMERILQFLDVPWNDSVLHHEEFVNKPGGISLSKLERSTDQVIKPINLEALTKWVGFIPRDVTRDMATLAPMLAVFGYDPHASTPDYGKPDSFVIRNTKEIEENKDIWAFREKEMQRQREAMRKDVLKPTGDGGRSEGSNENSNSSVGVKRTADPHEDHVRKVV